MCIYLQQVQSYSLYTGAFLPFLEPIGIVDHHIFVLHQKTTFLMEHLLEGHKDTFKLNLKVLDNAPYFDSTIGKDSPS